MTPCGPEMLPVRLGGKVALSVMEIIVGNQRRVMSSQGCN